LICVSCIKCDLIKSDNSNSNVGVCNVCGSLCHSHFIKTPSSPSFLSSSNLDNIFTLPKSKVGDIKNNFQGFI
jgi:hypothetical protein